MKKKVLFVCNGNSARSQMAEAFLRTLGGDGYEVYSGGKEARGVHPLTVEVMREVGIDISNQRSKNVTELLGQMSFDEAIIVCRRAEDDCPTIAGTTRIIHRWIFEDPVRVQGTDERKSGRRSAKSAIRSKRGSGCGSPKTRKPPVSANRSLPAPPAEHPPEFIKLLANDVRWGLLKALTTSDYQVNELVAQLQQPMNLVSYHLKRLRDDALVTTRRSEADGRDVYYSLDLVRLRQLYAEAGRTLHPALGGGSLDSMRHLARQRVLFLCTHNSARSQMAEGLLRHLSRGQLDVFSAGSQPTAIHPNAVRTMRQLGIDIRQQRVHDLSVFADEPFDYVITVCDKVREVCPTFPGGGRQIHWGLPDPVPIEDNAQRADAFLWTAHQLQSRIGYFLTTLPTIDNPEGATD